MTSDHPRDAATTCAKRRYRDRIHALLAIESHGRKKPRHKDTVRAYRCPTCRGWHLTSQPKWRGANGSAGGSSATPISDRASRIEETR